MNQTESTIAGYAGFSSSELSLAKTGASREKRRLIETLDDQVKLGHDEFAAKLAATLQYRCLSHDALNVCEANFDSISYPEAVAHEVNQQIALCSNGLFDAKKGSGDPSNDPIFIVGLPRAGSTLLEQILASHSQVEGTTELPDVMAIGSRLNGRQAQDEDSRYPANLIDVPVEELTRLGQSYLSSTRVHRREGAARCA